MYAAAKFSKPGVYEKLPEESTLIFADTSLSLKYSVGLVEKSFHAKTGSIRPSLSMERRLVTDTDRQTGTGS